MACQPCLTHTRQVAGFDRHNTVLRQHRVLLSLTKVLSCRTNDEKLAWLNVVCRHCWPNSCSSMQCMIGIRCAAGAWPSVLLRAWQEPLSSPQCRGSQGRQSAGSTAGQRKWPKTKPTGSCHQQLVAEGNDDPAASVDKLFADSGA